jgi:transcriptional regulator with XRE-family HTH domain
MAVDTRTARRQALLEHLASEIDRVMQSRRLTQDDLSARAGVSQMTVSRLLRARNPQVGTLVNVADGLGCNVEIRFVPRSRRVSNRG